MLRRKLMSNEGEKGAAAGKHFVGSLPFSGKRSHFHQRISMDRRLPIKSVGDLLA
jgi:hypothetical protein